MPDIYCSKCGEPWDSFGITHCIGEGDMTREEAIRFRHGEGCPSCGFGSKCPNCNGTGKQISFSNDCLCHGHRYIVLAKCPTAPNSIHRNWFIQYSNPPIPYSLDKNTIELKDESYKPYQCRDGWVYLKKILCPKCKDKAPICPECNGTGKFNSKNNFFEKSIESFIEASDEDPIKLLKERNDI